MKKGITLLAAASLIAVSFSGCTNGDTKGATKQPSTTGAAITTKGAVTVATKSAITTTGAAVTTAKAVDVTTTGAAVATTVTAVTTKAVEVVTTQAVTVTETAVKTTDSAVATSGSAVTTTQAVTSKVLQKIGEEVITEEDVNVELANLPEQYKAYYDNPEGKTRILENLINQKILKLVAIRDGIEKDEGYIKEISKIKERVLANYIVKKNIIEKVVVTDEDVKKKYEENKESYKTGEEVKASHILVRFKPDIKDDEKAKLKAKAEAILKDALAGKDFAELAKTNSEDGSAQSGGSLGWFGKGRMVKPFEDASFTGEVGKVYPQVVETQFGYHIVKVDEKKPASYKPIEEVKEQLKEELLNGKRSEEFTKWMDGLKKEFIK